MRHRYVWDWVGYPLDVCALTSREDIMRFAKEHAGHEAQHSLMMVIVIVSLFAFQILMVCPADVVGGGRLLTSCQGVLETKEQTSVQLGFPWWTLVTTRVDFL